MTVIANLPYRQPHTVTMAARCTADLYLPTQATAADCLIWAHGGGMTGGDKSGPNIVEPLLKAGVAVISPDYRLLHHAPWPACIEDLAAVAAWSRGALAAQGVTCKRLFIGGISAGAYLAAVVALDRRWLAIHGMDPTTFAGVIPLSGQMSSHFAYATASGHPSRGPLIDTYAPLWHVRADAPPMLLITGDQDIPGRDAENRLMLATMQAIGHTQTSHHTIPGRDHSTIAGGLADPADPASRLIHRFLGLNG